MPASRANLLNALVLLTLGAWGYLGKPAAPAMVLLPVFFGALLLLCLRGLRSGNRVAAYLTALLTALALVALLILLAGAAGRGEGVAIFRYVVMLVASLFSLLVLFQGFRRDRIS